MVSKFVGFMGGHFIIDGHAPFTVLFRADQMSFNGQTLDMEWEGRIEVERNNPEEAKFVETKLIRERGYDMNISFDCSISIRRLASGRVEIIIDRGHLFMVEMDLIGIMLDQEVVDFTKTDVFSFERKSGEDAASVQLVVGADNTLRVHFRKIFFMSYLPIFDSGSASMHDPKPLRRVCKNRLEAYDYQQLGMIAVKDEPGRPEWEEIVLTPDEATIVNAEIRANRQRKFENACACT